MSLERKLKTEAGRRAYERVFKRGEVYVPKNSPPRAPPSAHPPPPPPAFAPPPDSPQIKGYEEYFREVERRLPHSKILVGLKGKTPWQRDDIAEALAKEFGLPLRRFKYIPYAALTCDRTEAPRVYANLSRLLDKVSHTEKAGLVWLPELPLPWPPPPTPRPPCREVLWNLADIGVPGVRGRATGRGVAVAVLDTGADYDHPEIAARFGECKGYDVLADSADPRDRHGHGTHVSGTLAGQTTGVAAGSRLYAVKVLDDHGASHTADLIAGLEWCIDHDVDIVNMSLGSPAYSQALYQACQAALARGLALVAAAGNSGQAVDEYPAHYDGVIAVASVNRAHEHSRFSTLNPKNDISAPGEDIYSSVPGGYAVMNGTSMAAPHVAGSLAVLKEKVRADPDTLEQILKDAAERLGNRSDAGNWSKYGPGLVRVDQMLAAVTMPAYAGRRAEVTA